VPLDIQAPHRLVRLEAQRLERDGDLRIPPGCGDARGRAPDAVPVQAAVLGVVRHLPIGSCAGWVHLEEEAVPVVEERVEDHGDAIVHFECGVTREHRRHDALRVPVAAPDAEVDVVLVH